VNYTRALAARRGALAASRAARGELGAAVDEVLGTYQAHPVAVLLGAAGVGCVLARARIGSGFVRAGMRVASGPGWRLLRQYLRPLA
jgi:hypothetical protein